MILEGLKLMVIGMAIVYIFLIVLMLLIILSSKVFKEKASTTIPKNRKENSIDNKELIAVVSAAISAYRAKKS